MARIWSRHVMDQVKEQSESIMSTRTIADLATLVKRGSSTATATSTCASDSTAAVCQKPTNVDSPLLIGVCAAVPTVLTLVLIFFLHRRVRRRLRAEDANDPHKSLDFGLDDVQVNSNSTSKSKSKKSGRKEMSEMTVTELNDSLRPMRGLSMDMSSPYLLPPGLQGSRDTVHSMSRSNDVDDPYRPVTFMSDSSPQKSRFDNSSIYTKSSEWSQEKSRLVTHAQRMSRTASQTQTLPMPPSESVYSIQPQGMTPTTKSDRWYPKDDKKYGSESSPDLDAAPATPQDLLSDKPYMPPFPLPVQKPLDPQRHDSHDQQPYMNNYDQSRNPATDALYITVPSPTHNRDSPPRSPAATNPLPPVPSSEEPYQTYEAPYESFQDTYQMPIIQEPYQIPTIEEPPQVPHHQEIHEHGLPVGDHRASFMGLRPLPPDDPNENPEQRANRIRSFYREYFDESKPNPAGQYPQYDPQGDEYYADFLDDGAVYDPETGAFYTHQSNRQFAEPIGRRAMTPPPRGAAQGGPGRYGGRRSTASTQSATVGGGRRPMAPPKRIIPPSALKSLPTPHLIKDDTASPIDFAPPVSFRDLGLGRVPDSPTGSARPYSPAFRAHTLLVQSFDDLAVMPSPHALRKSGTFTSLDFAAPPRFRGMGDNGSDSGSIRSNRSGISAVQRDAIRAGAYRVSRLPKEMVTTKMDLATTLKPTWDMRK